MPSSLSWAFTSPKPPATRRRTKSFSLHIDNGHALTLEKVQHEIIRFSDSRAPRAFALTHAVDSSVCNHRCPRCCDSRGETPRPSRSSSSPRSHSSSRAGSPRRTFSGTATPINTYWRDQGLAHQYHTFAAILQSNYVSPHQVILDADIDGFSHPDSGPALMQAAAKYPEETTLRRRLRVIFFSASLSCCWERTGTFLRRALHLEGCCFAFVFLCVCVWRARSTSFRYQMVLPFV
jgi:hypothetical protein